MLVNRSVPRSTVIPQLAYPDVIEAVRWLCAAFGFTMRISMGSHRAQLNVGDGAIVIMETPQRDEKPGGSQNSPSRGDSFCSVMIRIPDVNEHCERARLHGARIVREPADHPYGERQYAAEDFAGRVWTFTQSIFDARPEDWGGQSGAL